MSAEVYPRDSVFLYRADRLSAVRQAELSLKQAIIRLAEHLEDATITKQDVAAEFNLPLLRPDVETLRQTALRERPDVQAAEREVEAARERLVLEQARSHTDITPFVGYKRLAADNTVMAGISIPLKTQDKNQAGIARAEADQKTAETLLEVARSHTIAEVDAAYEAFDTARGQVQIFRNEVLNQADESRSIALAAYEEGATPLLLVLEAHASGGAATVFQDFIRLSGQYQ